MGTAEPSFLNEIRASDLCFRYKEAVPVPESFDLNHTKRGEAGLGGRKRLR